MKDKHFRKYIDIINEGQNQNSYDFGKTLEREFPSGNLFASRKSNDIIFQTPGHKYKFQQVPTSESHYHVKVDDGQVYSAVEEDIIRIMHDIEGDQRVNDYNTAKTKSWDTLNK